jgi:hypothetical protein
MKKKQLDTEAIYTGGTTVDGTGDSNQSTRGCTRQYQDSSTALVIDGAGAQGNFFQDIVTGPDSHQVIANTRGNFTFEKSIKAAQGAVQWLGRISDTTLQQMAHCHKHRGRLKSKASETQVVTPEEYHPLAEHSITKRALDPRVSARGHIPI